MPRAEHTTKMKKKILSMTLALCLVFGSAAALAADTAAAGGVTAAVVLSSNDTDKSSTNPSSAVAEDQSLGTSSSVLDISLGRIS